MSFRGKILVVRGGAIGDFILTLPAIAALRERFPAAVLHVLGYPHIAQLALAGGLVNQVQSIEAGRLAAFFARGGALSEELATYFSEFDIIVSYLYDPDGIFQENVKRCAKAQFIQGPHRADAQSGIHAAKFYLQPLERLAIFDADPVPSLKVTPSAPPPLPPAEGNRPRAREVALHPGSGSEQKNWPEEKWAELMTRLVQTPGLNLLLVGGEAEGERLQRLGAAMPPARLRVAQSLPLARLAQRLATCSGFVGHDSGISHLAAAVGLPGLILWGDTAAEIWRPLSERVTILRHPEGLSNLPVKTVLERLEELAAGWPDRGPGAEKGA